MVFGHGQRKYDPQIVSMWLVVITARVDQIEEE